MTEFTCISSDCGVLYLQNKKEKEKRKEEGRKERREEGRNERKSIYMLNTFYLITLTMSSQIVPKDNLFNTYFWTPVSTVGPPG